MLSLKWSKLNCYKHIHMWCTYSFVNIFSQESLAKAQEQHFAEVANVLRKVCPSAAPSSPASSEWLQTFAENLKKELDAKDAEKKQIQVDLSSKLTEKDKERRQLESDLQQKIKEKESIAKEIENKLQQQIKEKELAKVKLESELQKKIKEEAVVREQLDKAKNSVTVVKEQRVDDSRVKDLEAQNEQLQQYVDKYKRIIADTVNL